MSIEKAPLRPIRNVPRFNHKRMRRRCAARVFQYIVWHPRQSGMTRRKCLTTTTTHQNNARCIDVRCSAALGNNPDNMRGGWMLLVGPFPTLFFVDPPVKGFPLLRLRLLSEVSDLSSRVPRVATPATTREDGETQLKFGCCCVITNAGEK